MLTTALTLIEGAYALPRPHPLDDLPMPLRHEWALLAPGDSLRNEPRSLYAALLHTICLSDRELLLRRRWNGHRRSTLDGQPAGVASSAAARHGGASRAAHHDVSLDASRAVPPETAQPPRRIALKPRRPGTAKRRASRHWHGIAGGMCIVGAAAVLAWLAMDRHRALRQLASEWLRPAIVTAGDRNEQVRAQPPHVDMTSRHAIVVDASPANAAHVAPAHADVALASAAALAAIHGGVSRQASGGDTPAHPSQRTHVTTGTQRQTVSGGQASPPPQRRQAPRATAMRAAQNTSPALHARSAARPGTSFEHAWPARSEYAAIRTSAARYPRGSTSNNRQANISTEWMNHMTQRRVTEIPEQFGQ